PSCRDEVVVFQEIAAEFRHEEHDHAEEDEKYHHAERVLYRVVGMKRYAIARMSGLRIDVLFDLDPVGIVRAYLVKRHDVRNNEPQQHQRYRDDMEREKPVQRRIGDHVVTAYPLGQGWPNQRYRIEQVDDHLRAPIRHLTPR